MWKENQILFSIFLFETYSLIICEIQYVLQKLDGNDPKIVFTRCSNGVRHADQM